MAQKILITGGLRSGKSRIALSLANASSLSKFFIATAEKSDEEMQERIENHQKERDRSFKTIEEPVHLAEAINNLPNDSIIIIDCLTLWVNNLFYHLKDNETKIESGINFFLNSYKNSKANIIIITNETGWGIIPNNALSRRYIEEIGRINSQVASLSDEVILMVSGIPTWIKGEKHD